MLCLAGCLAACVTAVSATAARPASGQPATRVMTCNVRITGLPEDETAGRRWEDCRDACLKAIRMYRPDVICMQEVIYDSYNYFKEKFSDYVAYGFAGPEMDPYTEGYHFIGKNVIFFSKKRYEFVSSGCYWLCAQYADGFPQIICGDFNSGIENAPVACLRDAGWQEAYEAVHGPGEAGFTYHGFKGPDYRKKNARRIDFIFVRGNLQPVAAEILRDKVDGLYPSDHYFLMSDFIIQ